MRGWFLTGRIVGASICLALLLACSCPALAGAESAGRAVTRHPLEIRALTDPQGVLRELPVHIKRASAAKDSRQLALLYLAQANACRVIADWPCQRDAGQRARAAAAAAGLPELEVRGLIAESRGRLTMQDFTRGERLLGDAERLLELHPFPELKADVYLAYSSLSYTLGKHALAADYAERGLQALGTRPALTIRIRLLRNQANAMGQLGNTDLAKIAVKKGLALVDQIQDPKLSAELHLEDARIARLQGDVDTQVEDGRKILALATQLSNSQLTGLGHEVLGLAALGRPDRAEAERELRRAYASYRQLKLRRDERRALRALVANLLGREPPPADLEDLTARLIELETALESDDHKLASDDFDARLKYAQQTFEVQRLEAAAALAAQREAALADQQRLSLIITMLSIGLLVVMGGFFLSQRRFSARLQQVIAQLRESEALYRDSAEALSASEKRIRAVTDNIPALIAHVDMEERYLFANAFVGRVFNIDPSAMLHHTVREIRGEEIYADLKPHIDAALRGESVSFEGKAELGDRTFYYQTSYVPDRDANGNMQGFYAFTFDITALKAAEAELDHLARIDSLTGVANRRDFEEHLAEAITRSRRHREPIALLCLDIDHFKAINDVYGHPIGDAVLLEFATRLKTAVREDDLVARLGGDEFVVLIENPGPESPEIVAGKLLAIMREPMITGALTVRISASIGVVHSPYAFSAQVLMSLADKALYAAKAAGRDTYRTVMAQ
jgi:diguanylate cyclase (GGDEF)-like protein/PAS domain S-box-containing protein